MAADLIEEVVRMYGFDNIPSTLPEMSMTIGKRTEIQEKKHMMKVLLKDLGLHETLTYSLTSPSLVHDFNIFHDQEPVKLAMPLGEERSVTRQSIIGSLLQVINYNQSRNMKDVHLYELSTTYSKGVELQNLAIACTGEYHGLSFKQISYKADYYLVKGFVETIFERLGINESRYRLERVESDNESFHPGRSAYIKVQNEVVGVVGQVHPLMEKKYDVKDVYVVELNLSALLNIKTGKVKYQPIPQYPSVSRDIALVMDESVPANDVCQKIIKSSNKLVKFANIFDVYVGEHVEAGKKSVAIYLTFQDEKKTLEEKESNFKVLYPDNAPLKEKVETIAKEIYGADGVTYEPAAEKMLAKLTDLGFGDLPVCMAKTQYSLSDDQTKLGRPEGFNIHVRDAFVNAGAGFVVILTGAIMTMPGLPKKPAAFGIDVDDNGKITGLF